MLNRSATSLRVERIDPALVPIYQAMTPAQRVTAGLSATDLVRDRLWATIRESHPEWTEEVVAQAVSARMLGALSGTRHRVYSGVCLWRRPEDALDVRFAVTTLEMDPLSEQQLNAYLDSGEWQGKAGAFGYQDRLGWVHILEGSESNVVGLPMELVERMLSEGAGT